MTICRRHYQRNDTLLDFLIGAALPARVAPALQSPKRSRDSPRPPWPRPIPQIGDGHDMKHYADDLTVLIQRLDLKKAVVISAVPPPRNDRFWHIPAIVGRIV
jgi:hypothetical protein